MDSMLVIVAAIAPPLAGSTRPAAFERFCGERLIDRMAAALESALDGAKQIAIVEPATTPLVTLLREAVGMHPTHAIGLAVDATYPMLSHATLRELVNRARTGAIAAAGRSLDELAAVAMPLPAPATDAIALVESPASELERVVCKTTLVELERQTYRRRAAELLAAGLLIRDPATTRIEGQIAFGVDVEIEPGCSLRGPITLGDRVRIASNCVLIRATIGADTDVRAFSIIEDASIGESSFIGPYARVRPGTSVGARAQIGNFVELKAAQLGRANRINHLSFVGDATFADDVTIGAGTITSNHDGVGKQVTTIGAGAYVGSNCVLVAPVTIGDGATIGAGSTITKDAPSSKLTLARTRQVVVEGWQRKKRE